MKSWWNFAIWNLCDCFPWPCFVGTQFNLKQIIFGGVCVCRMNEASTMAIFGFAELAE